MWGSLIKSLLCSLLMGASNPDFFIVQTDSIGPYLKATTSFKVACGGESPVFNLEKKPSNLEKVIEEIKKADPKVIVTVGKLATIGVAREIKDKPVIFGIVLNPKGKVFSQPNVAGISLTIPISRQIETLTALIPDVKAIGTLYNPKKSKDKIKELMRVARERGIKIIASRIDEPKDAPRAIRALVGDMDAFLLLPDPTVANKEVFFQLLKFVVERKIPLWTPSPAFVQAGALVSLAPSYEGIGQQMCEIAKKVLAGTPPSEIGIQTPERFELTFNLKTAEQLNLNTLPLTAAKYCVQAKCKINVF